MPRMSLFMINAPGETVRRVWSRDFVEEIDAMFLASAELTIARYAHGVETPEGVVPHLYNHDTSVWHFFTRVGERESGWHLPEAGSETPLGWLVDPLIERQRAEWEEENDELTETNRELQHDHDKLEKELDELKSEVSSVASTLEETIEAMQRYDTLEDRVVELKREIESRVEEALTEFLQNDPYDGLESALNEVKHDLENLS